jgi:hypothetical protein
MPRVAGIVFAQPVGLFLIVNTTRAVVTASSRVMHLRGVRLALQALDWRTAWTSGVWVAANSMEEDHAQLAWYGSCLICETGDFERILRNWRDLVVCRSESSLHYKLLHAADVSRALAICAQKVGGTRSRYVSMQMDTPAGLTVSGNVVAGNGELAASAFAAVLTIHVVDSGGEAILVPGRADGSH